MDDVKSIKTLVDHDYPAYRDNLQRSNSLVKLFSSEFLGTFIFVYIGQCVITSFEFTGTQSETSIKLLGTLICYSLSLLVAVLLTLSVSGAHLNPAFTIAAATFGHLNWHKVPIYLLGQYSGSFVAACFLHITYNDKIAHRHAEGLLNGMNMTLRAHGNILSSGKFFTTFPPIEVSLTQLFISYSLATTHFSLLLISIYESKLVRLPKYLQPIYVAMALLVTLAAFCANGGPAINPAVDFAPRLYISLSGWGTSAFNLYHYTYWWLCGILAPHLGALIGVGLYKIIITLHKNNNNSNHYSSKYSSRDASSCVVFSGHNRHSNYNVGNNAQTHNVGGPKNNVNNNNNSNGSSLVSNSSFSHEQHDNPLVDNNAQSLLSDNHRERQRVSTSTMISNISCASRTMLNTTENMRQHNKYLLEKYQQD